MERKDIFMSSLIDLINEKIYRRELEKNNILRDLQNKLLATFEKLDVSSILIASALGSKYGSADASNEYKINYAGNAESIPTKSIMISKEYLNSDELESFYYNLEWNKYRKRAIKIEKQAKKENAGLTPVKTEEIKKISNDTDLSTLEKGTYFMPVDSEEEIIDEEVKEKNVDEIKDNSNITKQDEKLEVESMGYNQYKILLKKEFEYANEKKLSSEEIYDKVDEILKSILFNELVENTLYETIKELNEEEKKLR